MDLLATVKKMVSVRVGGDHPANSPRLACVMSLAKSGRPELVCSNEKPDTVKMDAAVPVMGGSQACSCWDHDESCFESLKRYARATGMGGLKRSHFRCKQQLNLDHLLFICTARRVPAG